MTAPQSPGGSLQVHELLCWLFKADLVLAVSFLQFVLSKSSSCIEERNCFLYKARQWAKARSSNLAWQKKELRSVGLPTLTNDPLVQLKGYSAFSFPFSLSTLKISVSRSLKSPLSPLISSCAWTCSSMILACARVWYGWRGWTGILSTVYFDRFNPCFLPNQYLSDRGIEKSLFSSHKQATTGPVTSIGKTSWYW